MRNEARFRMVEKLSRERFARFVTLAQRDADERIELYRQLAEIRVPRRALETEDGADASGPNGSGAAEGDA